jgi:hypothetical protein
MATSRVCLYETSPCANGNVFPFANANVFKLAVADQFVDLALGEANALGELLGGFDSFFHEFILKQALWGQQRFNPGSPPNMSLSRHVF